MILWFFFFFSSRRRHTRLTCDWSSDVCSSDLPAARRGRERELLRVRRLLQEAPALRFRRRAEDRGVRGRAARSEERRVGKSVDLGGRRIIKKKRRKKERGRV